LITPVSIAGGGSQGSCGLFDHSTIKRYWAVDEGEMAEDQDDTLIAENCGGNVADDAEEQPPLPVCLQSWDEEETVVQPASDEDQSFESMNTSHSQDGPLRTPRRRASCNGRLLSPDRTEASSSRRPSLQSATGPWGNEQVQPMSEPVSPHSLLSQPSLRQLSRTASYMIGADGLLRKASLTQLNELSPEEPLVVVASDVSTLQDREAETAIWDESTAEEFGQACSGPVTPMNAMPELQVATCSVEVGLPVRGPPSRSHSTSSTTSAPTMSLGPSAPQTPHQCCSSSRIGQLSGSTAGFCQGWATAPGGCVVIGQATAAATGGISQASPAATVGTLPTGGYVWYRDVLQQHQFAIPITASLSYGGSPQPVQLPAASDQVLHQLPFPVQRRMAAFV